MNIRIGTQHTLYLLHLKFNSSLYCKPTQARKIIIQQANESIGTNFISKVKK